MTLLFVKMHNLGNDFIIINTLSFTTATRSSLDLSPARIQLLANRHLGIGCDQLLLLEPTRTQDADFHCRIFNRDGSEAGMSGNGLLSLARLIDIDQLSPKRTFTITTSERKITVTRENDGHATLGVGAPNFTPSSIPLLVAEQSPCYNLYVEALQKAFKVGAVSMGNPHIILPVDDVTAVDMERDGAYLSRHPWLPQGANVNFMQILSNNHIKLRTYERGTGETLACGSGSCAAVAVGRLWNLLGDTVTVSLQCGDLMVKCPTLNSSLLLRGMATMVFRGETTI